MTTKYFAVLTNQGAALLANAAALGTKVNITSMAIGDGGGALPTPDPAQTKLIGEKRLAPLNSLTIDAANSSQIIAEQVIPEGEGGFWIREIGLYDADGILIAVANCAETYKPKLEEGSGRTQTVRMILIVNSTTAVTLKIDPSVVLATRKYVDDAVIVVKAYADSLMDTHLKATDPHTQYAPRASPTFTGKPKAPTAAAGDDSTQLATTAFVAAAVAALSGGAPAALDTLKEIAAALGNDAEFSTTMATALAGKMDIAKNGSDIESVPQFLESLGLSELSKMARYLVRTGSNANGWYEVYSDGYIRMGGKFTSTNPLSIPVPAQGVVVNFPLSFSTTINNISVICNAGVSNYLEFSTYTSETLSNMRIIGQYATLSATQAATGYLDKFIGYYVVEGI